MESIMRFTSEQSKELLEAREDETPTPKFHEREGSKIDKRGKARSATMKTKANTQKRDVGYTVLQGPTALAVSMASGFALFRIREQRKATVIIVR